MKNIEKNCLQGLKRQNKLFANIICIKKIVCIAVRASDRVRKKITNYAEIFRNIMRKKVLIMRKTRWIMRKFSARFARQKSYLFMQPKSSCPRSRESARRLFLNKKNYIGIWAFPVIFICIWDVMKLSYQLCDVQ